MRPRLRQIIAWVLLVAFCGMTGTKAFHHHHWKAAEDIVCPLDGLAMSHHTLAHSILEALDEDDHDCAICHFTVTKVVIPTCLIIFNENPGLCFSTLFYFQYSWCQSVTSTSDWLVISD